MYDCSLFLLWLWNWSFSWMILKFEIRFYCKYFAQIILGNSSNFIEIKDIFFTFFGRKIETNIKFLFGILSRGNIQENFLRYWYLLGRLSFHSRSGACVCVILHIAYAIHRYWEMYTLGLWSHVKGYVNSRISMRFGKLKVSQKWNVWENLL